MPYVSKKLGALKKPKGEEGLDSPHWSCQCKLIPKTTHSLWANLLKAKYFPKTSFLRSQCKAQNLALWRGIQNCKTILFDRVCWSIVDGRSVRIFEDCWLPDHTWPIQRLANAPPHQLICTPSGHWDMELISEVFDSDTTVAILNTPINKFDPVGRDKFT